MEKKERKRNEGEENQFRFNFASINAIQSHGRPSSTPQVKTVMKKTETNEAQKSKEIIIELTASEAPEDIIL